MQIESIIMHIICLAFSGRLVFAGDLNGLNHSSVLLIALLSEVLLSKSCQRNRLPLRRDVPAWWLFRRFFFACNFRPEILKFKILSCFANIWRLANSFFAVTDSYDWQRQNAFLVRKVVI